MNVNDILEKVTPRISSSTSTYIANIYKSIILRRFKLGLPPDVTFEIIDTMHRDELTPIIKNWYEIYSESWYAISTAEDGFLWMVNEDKFELEDLQANAGISEFITKLTNINCKVYQDFERMSTFLVFEQSWYGYDLSILASIITALCPWLFPGLDSHEFQSYNDNLSLEIKEEYDEAIRSEGIAMYILADYLDCKLEPYLTPYQEELLTKQLEVLSSSLTNRRVNALRSKLKRDEDLYRQQAAAQFKLYQSISELKDQIRGLEWVNHDKDNPIDELGEFIKSVPELSLGEIDAENQLIYVCFEDELQFWEDEDYQICVENAGPNESFYRQVPIQFTHETAKEFYKKIFSTRELKVLVHTTVSIDLETGILNIPERNIGKKSTSCWHPHLNSQIMCWGTAERGIREYIEQMRIPEALNAMLYATKQFTLSDAFIAPIFVRYIFGIDEVDEPLCIQNTASGEIATAAEWCRRIQEGEYE